MNLNRSAALALCALAIATTPACSRSDADTATESTTSSAASSEPLTAATPTPMPTDALAAQVGVDPCSLLTGAEAEEALGTGPASATFTFDSDKARVNCDWIPPADAPKSVVGILVGEAPTFDGTDMRIAGYDVSFAGNPDFCMATAKSDSDRGVAFRIYPVPDKVDSVDPVDTWCKNSVTTMEAVLTRLAQS
ncbi:DUF3558 family protein [Rhodococcus gannanensis]|uniref:DUF3558 family protein n=1 Tax=Rhodococcus gannanensis TaxID=1960308 RepID=A0ABW4PFA0_9NOCA